MSSPAGSSGTTPAAVGAPEQAIVEPLAVATCDLDRAIVEGSTPFQGPFALGQRWWLGRPDRRRSERGEARRPRRRSLPDSRAPSELPARPHQLQARRDVRRRCRGRLRQRRLATPCSCPCRRRRAGDGSERAGNIFDAWRSIVPPLRDRPGGRVLILAGRAPTASPCTRCRSRRRAGPSRSRSSPATRTRPPRPSACGADVELVDEPPESQAATTSRWSTRMSARASRPR